MPANSGQCCNMALVLSVCTEVLLDMFKCMYFKGIYAFNFVAKVCHVFVKIQPKTGTKSILKRSNFSSPAGFHMEKVDVQLVQNRNPLLKMSYKNIHGTNGRTKLTRFRSSCDP